MNTGVCVSLDLLSSVIYPGVELLNLTEGQFQVLRNLQTVFIVALPIYTPAGSVLGLPLLHILAEMCYCKRSENSHSENCEVISHCGF